MLYARCLYLALAASTAMASSLPGGDELMASRRQVPSEASTKCSKTEDMINIDTYMTLFANNETYEGGWLSDDIVERQMQVLNDGFSSCRIGFTLKGVQRNLTSMPRGFDPDEKIDFEFYGRYRKGSYKALNIYYSPDLVGGVATFPGMRGALHLGTAFNVDGCRVNSHTTPGGKAPNQMGKTTIHEVGHWLGLLHTFQGGCDEAKGDFIGDTPAMNETVGKMEGTCPRGQNSCPGLDGVDPIHNYMSYTTDECRTEFTRQQCERMRSIWQYIRIDPAHS